MDTQYIDRHAAATYTAANGGQAGLAVNGDCAPERRRGVGICSQATCALACDSPGGDRDRQCCSRSESSSSKHPLRALKERRPQSESGQCDRRRSEVGDFGEDDCNRARGQAPGKTSLWASAYAKRRSLCARGLARGYRCSRRTACLCSYCRRRRVGGSLAADGHDQRLYVSEIEAHRLHASGSSIDRVVGVVFVVFVATVVLPRSHESRSVRRLATSCRHAINRAAASVTAHVRTADTLPDNNT